MDQTLRAMDCPRRGQDQLAFLVCNRGRRRERMDLSVRERGYFLGRELYFRDPSGNRLELRDPTWQTGMSTPTWEEIARQPRVTA